MLIKWIAEIWNRKFFIIYICFLSILLVAFINYFLIKRDYEYSFSYYITNSELAKLVIDIGTLEDDAQMANSCKILLENDYTTNTIGEMLIDKYGADYLSNYFTIIEDEDGENIAVDELKECIEVSIAAEGIPVLNVDIKTPNPNLTQSMGDFMIYLTPNVIYKTVGAGYISPFDNARMDLEAPPLGKKKVIAVGVALGFVISIIIIAVHKRLYKNLIMTKEDAESCSAAEIYTLGDIPFYEFDIKEGRLGKESG